jgi:hypothetical protein
MFKRKQPQIPLFTSDKLAAHIVDTLVDQGLVEKSRFEDAVAAAKWEIDAQAAIGRVIIAMEPK